MIHYFSEKPTNTIIRKNFLKSKERERKENLLTAYVVMIMSACVPFVVVAIRWLRFSR